MVVVALFKVNCYRCYCYCCCYCCDGDGSGGGGSGNYIDAGGDTGHVGEDDDVVVSGTAVFVMVFVFC